MTEEKIDKPTHPCAPDALTWSGAHWHGIVSVAKDSITDGYIQRGTRTVLS